MTSSLDTVNKSSHHLYLLLCHSSQFEVFITSLHLHKMGFFNEEACVEKVQDCSYLVCFL